nr:hypothetical protein Iba_chr07aCG10820 [Ipomoea batatas]GMD20759.1 hypothetical protein Iba_chr07fCG7750 [Ipomoea batatas]
MLCLQGRELKLMCGIWNKVVKFGLRNLLLKTVLASLPQRGLHLQHS